MGLTFNLGKLSNMITSTGSAVGIGQPSPSYTLDVSGTGRFTGALNGTSASFSSSVTASGLYAITSSEVRLYNANNTNWGTIKGSTDTINGSILLTGGSGNGMIITNGGNVGIGTSSLFTSSGYTVLDLYGASSGGHLLVRSPNVTAEYQADEGSGGAYLGTRSNHFLSIRTNTLERMRITSGGNVLIGTTTDDAGIWRLQVATNGDVGLRIKSSAAAYSSRLELAAAGAGASVINAQGGSNVLYVSANNTNGVYITSGATSWTGNSDERLKDITGNIENAVDSLMALRTVKHTWKSDENKKEHLALIAQDVEKVFPQVIDKNKLLSKANDDNPDETEYLGVRYTELVPVLVKAIQEQNQFIQQLKERLDKAGL